MFDGIFQNGTLIGVILSLIAIIGLLIRYGYGLWKTYREASEKKNAEQLAIYKETSEKLTSIISSNTIAFKEMSLSLNANTKASCNTSSALPPKPNILVHIENIAFAYSLYKECIAALSPFWALLTNSSVCDNKCVSKKAVNTSKITR